MPEPSATPKLLASTIDCVDLEAMTTFWATLLDVAFEIHEPFGFLAPSENRRTTLWLQRVAEERVGKNRIHLDMVVQDLDAVGERVVALGGTIVGPGGWQEFIWTTFADPEGNLFDIMAAQQPAE